MATVNFFTKGRKNPSTIYVRFVSGRKIDLKQSTSLNIDPRHWNKKKGAVRTAANFKGKEDLEKDLYDLRGEILHRYREAYSNGAIINAEWLNGVILNHFDQDKDLQTQLLVDYAEYHLKTLPNKVLRNGQTGVKPTTFRKYQGNLNKLKAFEQFKGKRFLIAEVDMNFHREFIDYLKTENHLNFNSIGKYLTMVRTICLDANATKGIKVNDAILNGNFKSTKEEINFVTLNEDEIKAIFDKDFSGRPYLDNARNWLIIGVWIGARVSDLLNLSKRNLRGEYLEYTAQKTGGKIIMPLHWQVKSIIDKLGGNLPKQITPQKFNDYIKIVCEEVGIDEQVKGSKRKYTGKKDRDKKKIWRKVPGTYKKHELVSTHICRRSFATNHYGKLPTPVIMSATGHKTQRMLLNYIGKAPKENADFLAEYWRKAKAKQERDPQFELIKNAN